MFLAMLKTLALLMLGVGLFFAWTIARRRFKARGGLGGALMGSRTLRRQLLKLTHDPEVAKRLVDAARARHPELSEAALLRRVIRKLERDRSR